MRTKTLLAALALVLMASTIGWAQRGLVRHDMEVYDELGRRVTDITSLQVNTGSSAQSIYQDPLLATAITNPMTTSSTNTTLSSGSCYWYGTNAFNLTIVSTVYGTATFQGLNSSITRVILPTYWQAQQSLAILDAQNLVLGTSSDVTINAGTVANRMTIIPIANDATLYIGDGTLSENVRIYGTGATVYAQFTVTGSELDFIGDYAAHLDDTGILYLGTDKDWSIKATAATPQQLSILPLTADESQGLNLGGNAAGADLTLYPATAGDFIRFDASSGWMGFEDTSLAMADATRILFGDALGTGQLYISATGAVLTIGQVAADTGTVVFGVDNVGMDVTWYGESASAYMKWDGTTADQLMLVGADSSGTLLAITGIDTTGNSDTVTIAHSGTGDALQITCTEADSRALNLVSAASQTTAVAIIDGSTGNWIGADDVGMLMLNGDTAQAHTGTTQLLVRSTAKPIASAEGFLARFVQDTGAATTTAYAVEIETTNTTPALYLNNQMSIVGADSGGTLLDITGIDTTGNTDTMTIAHSGTGDALQITCTEADSVALNLIGAAAQTTSIMKVDGATGADWRGAANVGMVHLISDGPLANIAASLLYIGNSGVQSNDAMGSSLRIVDSGTPAAGTAGYAVYISAANGTEEALIVDDGKVLVHEEIVSNRGVQTASVAVAAETEVTQSTIPAGSSFVTITSDDATHVVCLPVAVVGNKITIYCGATGCELQTIAASNATINGVDCDGAAEMVVTATNVYHLVCIAANTWVATAWTAAGAAVATIVPDADA